MPTRFSPVWIRLLMVGAVLPFFLTRPAPAQVSYPIPIQVLMTRHITNAARPSILPQEILIKFKAGVSQNQILSMYQKYYLREVFFSPFSGIRRCFVAGPIQSGQVVALLRAEPAILYAEQNWVGQVSLIPNDPLSRYQWHLGAMNMNLAWDISNGSGVIIAVLDTGVAYENFDVYARAPDLSGTSFVSGYDFVNDDPNPDDDEGHGTHITGTIAQTTNNLLGCAGGAFGATIMPVKVMDNTGNGLLTDIVDGIYYAVNNGAYILNLSLGFGDNPTLALEEAVNYAADSGCLVICSAGNYATNLPNYPAAYPACIAVSAVRFDRTLGDYSNYGSYIDLCAPGGDLQVDQNLDGYPDGILQQTHDGTNFTNFGYYMGRGTSWAAANASAVAALVISAAGGALTAAEVRSILETTARDLGTAGWDEYYGWGMVDAYAAVSGTLAAVATAQTLGTRIALATTFSPALSSPLALAASQSIAPWTLGLYSQEIQYLKTLTTLTGLIGGSAQRSAQGNYLAGLTASPVARISGALDLFQPLSLTGSSALAMNTSGLSSFISWPFSYSPWPITYSSGQHINYLSNALRWPLIYSLNSVDPFFLQAGLFF
ncbi:MAG: S8 family serine peptidase [bacterium]